MATDLLIADVTSVDWDNPTTWELLECTEAQDEEAESIAGTSVADTPLYSKITGMRMNLFFRAANACMIRWMLLKLPDGDTLAANLTDANFHSSNDVQANRELRKYTLAKGMIGITSDKLQQPLRIRVSRAAWRRASPMRENDKIVLMMAKNAENTTATLSGFGTIWVRANA